MTFTSRTDREPDARVPGDALHRYRRARDLAGADPLDELGKISELVEYMAPIGDEDDPIPLSQAVADRLDGLREALRLSEKQAEESQYELCTERDREREAFQASLKNIRAITEVATQYEVERDVLLSLVQRLLDPMCGPETTAEARAKVADPTKRTET